LDTSRTGMARDGLRRLNALTGIDSFWTEYSVVNTPEQDIGLNALTGIDSFWTETKKKPKGSVPRVLTPLRALIVFGHKGWRDDNKSFHESLNALTGIDSFWTQPCPDQRKQGLQQVLTPLRALIVFGLLGSGRLPDLEALGLNALTGIDSFWTYLICTNETLWSWKVLTPLRALIVFGHNGTMARQNRKVFLS